MRYLLESQYARIVARRKITRKRTIPQRREVIPREEFRVPQQAEVIQRHEFHHKKLKIEPVVRNLYNSYLDNYHHAKAEGSRRKLLPIGGLEKWYESRRAAYEAFTGADPVHFDDSLDKIDIAQATDGWKELDSELEKYHLFYEKEARPSKEEMQEIAYRHYEMSPEDIARRNEEYEAQIPNAF